MTNSEDEKIRKWLIDFFNQYKIDGFPEFSTGMKVDSIIAWLEKQGEQKTTDFRRWKYVVDAVLTEENGIGNYFDKPDTEKIAKKLQERFGNVKQRHEWNENDKKMVNLIISHYQQHILTRTNISTDRKVIYWLKTIKDKVLIQPK